MSEITRILQAVHQGENPGQRLWPLVYEELRKLAAHKMANERQGHTLQPTALVHEAWLRLGGQNDEGPPWENRAHFFAAAAEAMRRILVDSSRSKQALKRGGNFERVDLDDVDLAVNVDDSTLVRIDEAVQSLELEHPPSAELVRLRFYVGLSNEEADFQEISSPSAKIQPDAIPENGEFAIHLLMTVGTHRSAGRTNGLVY